MRYVFRADASQSIGVGHVMRSSAIAEELISRGEEVVFVGQISDLPWVAERISTLGFTDIYNNPSEFISDPESDVLILDSYEILESDDFINSENWFHIVAIVDQLTPDYHCSLRIHPGLDSNWVGNSKVPILAGPKYIPFRSSLSKNMYVESQEQHTLKIAVVAGGSDPYGLVHKIAKILVTFPEQFEVILFSDSILDSTLDSRFRCFSVGQHLDNLTKDVDLVLTTASTSSLEFLARGLCLGIVCAVNNQEHYYKSLGELGVAAQLGFRNINNIWELDNEKMHSLVKSNELRRNLMTKAKDLIAFEGASRIVDAITAL